MSANKTVTLLAAKCVAAEAGVDSSLIDAVRNFSAEANDAARKLFKGESNPHRQLVFQALETSASRLHNKIPALAAAIRTAGNYPDQLYLSFSKQPDVNQRIWPTSKYYENYPGQTFRFDNLSFPLDKPLDFNLWEYDYGGDDHLGSFTIGQNTAPGIYTATLANDSAGAIYIIAYSVADN